MKKRCPWCLVDQLYMDYHDLEWGVECHDDTKLFECLVLESFQSGLSWHTILKKREGFRRAFDGFRPKKIAQYGEEKVNQLLGNTDIIRHKAKILATINNAKQFLRLQQEYSSFDAYIWQFTNNKIRRLNIRSRDDVETTLPESDVMSKALKKEGFKFVGSVTCMAYMEAIGMVDSHFNDCWRSQ